VWYAGSILWENAMKKLTLDAELLAKLGGGAAKVTLTDEAGNAVGHYLPDDLYRSIIEALLPDENAQEAGLSELRAGDTVTTAELLSGLRESVARWQGEP